MVWNGRYLNLFYCLLIKCFGRFLFFSFLFGFCVFYLFVLLCTLLLDEKKDDDDDNDDNNISGRSGLNLPV